MELQFLGKEAGGKRRCGGRELRSEQVHLESPSRGVPSALGARVWSCGDKCGSQWLAHGTASHAAGQNHVGVKRGEETSEAEALQRCGAEQKKTHAPSQVPARPANAVDNPAS